MNTPAIAAMCACVPYIRLSTSMKPLSDCQRSLEPSAFLVNPVMFESVKQCRNVALCTGEYIRLAVYDRWFSVTSLTDVQAKPSPCWSTRWVRPSQKTLYCSSWEMKSVMSGRCPLAIGAINAHEFRRGPCRAYRPSSCPVLVCPVCPFTM